MNLQLGYHPVERVLLLLNFDVIVIFYRADTWQHRFVVLPNVDGFFMCFVTEKNETEGFDAAFL